MKVNIPLEGEPEIEVEYRDMWSIDSTLSLILEPLFKMFKEKTNKFIHVDNEDLPEHLQGPDGFYFTKHSFSKEEEKLLSDRMHWMLDEIIYAASSINNDWESDHDDYSSEEYKKQDSRIDNGFRLLGKYMRTFWD